MDQLQPRQERELFDREYTLDCSEKGKILLFQSGELVDVSPENRDQIRAELVEQLTDKGVKVLISGMDVTYSIVQAKDSRRSRELKITGPMKKPLGHINFAKVSKDTTMISMKKIYDEQNTGKGLMGVGTGLLAELLIHEKFSYLQGLVDIDNNLSRRSRESFQRIIGNEPFETTSSKGTVNTELVRTTLTK